MRVLKLPIIGRSLAISAYKEHANVMKAKYEKPRRVEDVKMPRKFEKFADRAGLFSFYDEERDNRS